MRPINKFRVRKGHNAGAKIRYRVQTGFYWVLGFVLGFIGVSL